MTHSSLISPLQSERGIALLTVMLLLIVMTLLGLMAVTVTALENRMAGNVLGQETATAAAESCMGTAVNILQQTITASALPAAYSASGGPVPSSNANLLEQEIMGFPNSSGLPTENNPDMATGPSAAPNLQVTVGAYSVSGDIDRLYIRPKSGTGIQSHANNEGMGAGGVEVLYRVDCTAQQMATGAVNHIVAIYACTLTGETCQKAI